MTGVQTCALPISALLPSFPRLTGERITRRAIESVLGIERIVKKTQEGYQPKGKANFYYNLAVRLFKKGMISQALPKAKKALEEDPEYAEANVLIGVFYSKQKKKDLDKATSYFLAALDLDPSSVTAHYNYAIACKDGNRLAEAIKEFGIVIEKVPTSAEAYYELGLTHIKNSDKVKAAESFIKALDIYAGSGEQKMLGLRASGSKVNPNKAYIYHDLAALRQEEGKLDEAVEEYKKANKEYKEIVGIMMKDAGLY